MGKEKRMEAVVSVRYRANFVRYETKLRELLSELRQEERRLTKNDGRGQIRLAIRRTEAAIRWIDHLRRRGGVDAIDRSDDVEDEVLQIIDLVDQHLEMN